MNLSKIAAGLAVSLFLAGNVIAADERTASNLENSLSLEDKLQANFDEIYNKHNLDEVTKSLKQKNLDTIKKIEKDGRKEWTKHQEDAKKILEQLTKEQREAITESYGYKSAKAALEASLDSNDEPINGIYYLFNFINNDLNKHKEELNSHLEKIKKNKNGIDLNDESLGENKKSISENKESIKKNSDDIKANKELLSLQQKAIDSLNKHLGDMNNVTTRLNKLTKEVSSGLATQAALNGLFQPYNVGKLNVSAALGGYKSENAVAVGAGFRFNKNVAAKAGISSSFDGSALSYNMGVNYEF